MRGSTLMFAGLLSISCSIAQDPCPRCIGQVGSFTGEWRDETRNLSIWEGYSIQHDTAFVFVKGSTSTEKAKLTLILQSQDKPYIIDCSKDPMLCRSSVPIRLSPSTRLDFSFVRKKANALLNDEQIARMIVVAATRSGHSLEMSEKVLCRDCTDSKSSILSLAPVVGTAKSGLTLRFRLCPADNIGSRLCTEPVKASQLCESFDRCQIPTSESALFWLKAYQVSNRAILPVDGLEALILVATKTDFEKINRTFEAEGDRLRKEFNSPELYSGLRGVMRALLLVLAGDLNATSSPQSKTPH
jgi:hypothetical protein